MGSSLAHVAILGVNDTDALLDLGFAYSTGTRGYPFDLVSAHKWFNLAAMSGSQQAQYCRADIAGQMTGREIAEAQRAARTWLAGQHAAH
jgi:TPR repeat protein